MQHRLWPWGLALASLIGMAVPGVASAAPLPRPGPIAPPTVRRVFAIPNTVQLPDRVWIVRGQRRLEHAREVQLVRRSVVLIAAAERAARQKQADETRARATTTTTTTAPAVASYETGACGGDLPPCYVMWRESRGIATAQNPYSSASGKWQILDSTWAGYGGYAHAKDAPEAVQDAKARTMALCNWQPPNYCA